MAYAGPNCSKIYCTVENIYLINQTCCGAQLCVWYVVVSWVPLVYWPCAKYVSFRGVRTLELELELVFAHSRRWVVLDCVVAKQRFGVWVQQKITHPPTHKKGSFSFIKVFYFHLKVQLKLYGCNLKKEGGRRLDSGFRISACRLVCHSLP